MKTSSHPVAGILVPGLTPAAVARLTFACQGQLLDNGEPFTGTTGLEFELFTADAGSRGLLTDVHPDHPVSNGLCQVQLTFDMTGARGLPDVEFEPLHLGIAADGVAVAEDGLRMRGGDSAACETGAHESRGNDEDTIFNDRFEGVMQ